ncbi:hypothetical protein AAULH_02448 [Lactobacillus helveticus MTCC 5463]|nr:hypothetical protein AAULH_02448 [Lactobacillus helveticus MTCC 5463]
MIVSCTLSALDGDNHQVVQILRTRYKKTLLKILVVSAPS